MKSKFKIPFSKPFIGEKEIVAASKVIKSGWITSGRVGEEFEKKFAFYVGSKYAIFLNSCTSALNLSVEWYKIKYKIKRILVPSMTFVATAQTVINAGLKPVFGDVSIDLLLIPSKEKYDAVIPVHLYGNKSLKKWDVPCIEDSAHLIEKNQCKNNPNIVVFSFFATKNLTTGEGGMLCTNDKKLYLWAKQMRHHGITRSGYERYGKNKWKYDVKFNGYKYNNSDILAAIGIEQLKKFNLIQSERKRCVDLYNKLLGYNNKGLHLNSVLVLSRSKFIKYMNKNGISCNVHFLPVHLMSIFKNKYKVSLPNTEYFGKRLVSLPLFPSLKNKEIKYICEKVLETGLLIK